MGVQFDRNFNVVPGGFSGQVRIIESLWCTDPEERTVTRTWRERLLTRPWRPWERTKTVTVQVPSKTGYFLDYGRTLVMHPETAKRLQESLKNQDSLRQSAIVSPFVRGS